MEKFNKAKYTHSFWGTVSFSNYLSQELGFNINTIDKVYKILYFRYIDEINHNSASDLYTWLETIDPSEIKSLAALILLEK
jgi:hypothetical protein